MNFNVDEAAFIAGKVANAAGDIRSTRTAVIEAGIILIPECFADEAVEHGWKRSRDQGVAGYARIERTEADRAAKGASA